MMEELGHWEPCTEKRNDSDVFRVLHWVAINAMCTDWKDRTPYEV